ncbi:MAG: alpha/beta fold hydrolase [Solirubrobacterales bacterium]|nr:alpha/beta fold hydrolase [Solirubrobacterales bacterium]
MASTRHPPRPARRRDAARAGDDYGLGDSPDWRTVDWASALHTVEIAGAPVNYVDLGEQGERRPIVFVHGLSGQWQNWLENIPRFARERRVVALDLPGFGRSPMPREPITIDFYGRVVAELCDRLGLAPAVLVGNSMGGYVAAEVAIAAPHAVERLMLVSSAGISQREAPRGRVLRVGRLMTYGTRSSTAQRRALAARPGTRHLILSMVVRHPTRLRPDVTLEGLMKGSGKPGFYDALTTCLDYDFLERLPEIGCPTEVVWGRQDAIIPVRDADRFVELIPGSRKVVMEDTGHVAMIERPVTFNDELQRFLEHEVAPGELSRGRGGAARGDRVV